jgi:hypothetical protein
MNLNSKWHLFLSGLADILVALGLPRIFGAYRAPRETYEHLTREELDKRCANYEFSWKVLRRDYQDRSKALRGVFSRDYLVRSQEQEIAYLRKTLGEMDLCLRYVNPFSRARLKQLQKEIDSNYGQGAWKPALPIRWHFLLDYWNAIFPWIFPYRAIRWYRAKYYIYAATHMNDIRLVAARGKTIHRLQRVMRLYKHRAKTLHRAVKKLKP